MTKNNQIGSPSLGAVTGLASAGSMLVGLSSGIFKIGSLTSSGGTISVTNPSDGVLNIDSSVTTIVVTGTTQAIAMGKIYRANSGSLLTFTLPVTAALDSEFEIIGQGAGLYKIAQNASQQILFLSQATTVGVTGSITATQRYQAIRIRCIAINTFSVITASGDTWTVV